MAKSRPKPKDVVTQTEAPDFTAAKNFYCNWSQMALGIWDVRLLLGEVLLKGPSEPFVVPQASLSMTYPHFKIFAKALSDAVKEYEEKNGEIKCPEIPKVKA